MEQKSKIPLTLSFIAVFLLGNLSGVLLQLFVINPAQRNLPPNAKELLDSVYSPAPDELFALNGSITAINGNEISLEIYDPEDQYPGPERRKEIRTVVVTNQTQLTEINYGIFIPEAGNFQTRSIGISDLSVGKRVSVTSKENIRDLDKFEAESILTSAE
jgi:hypothetical protein